MGSVRTASLCVVFAIGSIAAACAKRDDDRSIRAAPERADPSGGAAEGAGAGTAPRAAPSASAANPLAMPLKHDGRAAPAAAASVDPCAPRTEKGPMAMGLRHDGAPASSNPLCMRLK